MVAGRMYFRGFDKNKAGLIFKVLTDEEIDGSLYFRAGSVIRVYRVNNNTN